MDYRERIDKAIRTTLVIENKESIYIAVERIVNCLDFYQVFDNDLLNNIRDSKTDAECRRMIMDKIFRS